MDEQRLEEELRQSARQAERFFAARGFEPLRRAVALRISQGGIARRPSLARPFALAALAAVFAFLVVVARPGWQAAPLPGGPEPGVPVAQQAIKLDQGGASQWLSYFRLNQPDAASAALLAVVWTEESRGGWRALYSDLLGNNGEPLPAQSLSLPGSEHPLVLLAARDAAREYLDYNIIGYAGREVQTYRARQAVPGGSVQAAQGVLVERRAGGNEVAQGWQVTYLLPYQLEEDGDLLLPGQALRLEVGQFLELMGNDGGEAVQAVLRRGLLEAEAGGRFYAARAGEELLTLAPRGATSHARHLPVEIVDPQ